MKELLKSIGAVEQQGSQDWHLRTGATYIVLRYNENRLYCEVGNIYLGEITVERLLAIYFGLTGNVLKLVN